MTLRPSSLALIGANLVPLAGVLLFDWSVLGILLLYWSESVIVGIVNILRMATCESRGVLGDMLPVVHMERTERIRYHSLPGVPSGAVKLFLIPFFIVHYGMFCFGHLTAVVALFAPAGLSRKLGESVPDLWQNSYWIAVAAIAASHLYSYFVNFLAGREYQRINVMTLMRRPYGRIMVMQMSIIVGGALIAWLGDPIGMLVVLIGAKIWLDLIAHNQERLQLAESGA